MTKRELIEALEPFSDDIDLWMEVDAGIAKVGGCEYDPIGVDDYAILILHPAP